MGLNKIPSLGEHRGLPSSIELVRHSFLLEPDELKLGKASYWKQRAKARWAKEGDENFRYFHMAANGKKQRDVISLHLHKPAKPLDADGMLFGFHRVFLSVWVLTSIRSL